MTENLEHLDRALREEFSGHGEAIHSLKLNDNHFKKLLIKNHELFEQIQNIQNNITPADDFVLDNLEKQRLLILDEIGEIISAYEAR